MLVIDAVQAAAGGQGAACQTQENTVKTQKPAVGGAVYGVILNDQDSLARMGDALLDAPYKGVPKAPVLYIKPQGTRVGPGAVVRLPAGARAVEIGATLGLVLGRAVARVAPGQVLDALAGYVLVADLSLPHASYYRPAIREKCFDGACPMGARLLTPAQVGDVAQVSLRTYVNGALVATRSLADLVRDVPTLVADVAEFMTLRQGDALLVGVVWQAPQAVAGDVVRIEADGFEALEFSIAAGEGAA
jgi:5-oxopent-3-ene-1,2,5-tricarboxylate decarboxylase/2-hydroxyhepta-2,4-diene-1,7-dioate isomerase